MARLEPEAPRERCRWSTCAAVVQGRDRARAPLSPRTGIDLGVDAQLAAAVRGDAATLAMLIANLVDNALRYTPPGGRIDVAVDDEGGAAVLSVVDTGPGIPVGERERVFERFHRGEQPAAPGAGGSGLGLSIVRRIADAHGATVTLDDGPDGRGLLVRVRFPDANDFSARLEV